MAERSAAAIATGAVYFLMGVAAVYGVYIAGQEGDVFMTLLAIGALMLLVSHGILDRRVTRLREQLDAED